MSAQGQFCSVNIIIIHSTHVEACCSMSKVQTNKRLMIN